jgi:signal transduction histidine kinase/CheY-like chemotaxis protein
MDHSLIDPRDSLQRQNEKLLKIADTLMRRVEQDTDAAGLAYAQFERAVMLEQQVRTRTRDLERALDLLNQSNAQLAVANDAAEAARSNLANAIETVQEGFALFNAGDELVMCNSRFGMYMPDIRAALVPGLSFAGYVDTVSRSAHLSLPDDVTPDAWAARRMERHREATVVFNVRMTGNRWVQVSERRTPDGGTVILQTDVTDILRLERQERQRMLDDQARLIRATLEHLKQGICIFDGLGRLVGWNRRVGELLSLPVGWFGMGSSFAGILERVGRDYTLAGDIDTRQIASWAEYEGKRAPLNFEICGPGNQVLAVFMQQMPDGGFVISFTDLSSERAAIRAVTEARDSLEQRVRERTLELQDALSQAERANASKSRFVAAASHDLLQPLSAAKLYVSSLENTLEPEPREILSRAANALQSVEDILSALLDISKLDSGQAAVHVAPVSLDDILSQLQDELAPMARARGLKFRVLKTGAHVLSDATYLRRILQNLMSNALRYTPQGKILVGARQRRDTVRIEVHDTGPGIPEDQQEQIFGEFQRLNATANAADGMGLGLTIVERACLLLNHPLNLRSEPGRGTVFSVELRRAPAGARNDPAPAPAPVAETPPNLIVLLIENDADLRDALAYAMEQQDVDVLACVGEGEAMALLEEIDLSPDAIIADLQLDDGQSGIDAIRNLRARHGPLPACVISADRSPDLIRTTRELGLPLLHKPIDFEVLNRFLRGVVSGIPGKPMDA